MLVSPQAKVSSVCTPSCYALCAACDMLPNLPMRVRGAPWGPGRRTGGGAWSLRYRKSDPFAVNLESEANIRSVTVNMNAIWTLAVCFKVVSFAVSGRTQNSSR